MTDQISEAVLVILVAAVLLAVFAHKDRLNLWDGKRWNLEIAALAVITLITMVTLPIVDAAFAWIEFADLPYYDEAGWLGVLNGAFAVWLMFRAIHDYRAPRIQHEKLEHQGIYRYIRYPFYTALLVFALAQLLLSQNWLAGLAGLLTFSLVYGLRVPRDEEKGLERYGHRYLEYMSRTGDVLPRLAVVRQD